MAVSGALVRDAIREFAESIDAGPVGLARLDPVPGATPLNCIANALSARSARGGQVRYGWYFLLRESLDLGHYLIATHHAVWHDPDDLILIDVSPTHPDAKHQPLAQGNDVIFLVDDHAHPYERKDRVIPLPSRFHAIGTNAQLMEYVAKLQNEEFESYNQEHGSSFS